MSLLADDLDDGIDVDDILNAYADVDDDEENKDALEKVVGMYLTARIYLPKAMSLSRT